MKKILVLSVLALNFLFGAATNEQIINHFKSSIALDGLSFKVIERQKVAGYDGYEYAIVEVSQSSNVTDTHHNTEPQRLHLIIKDNIIFPEAIDVVKGKSLREDIEEKLYKKETK
ncbi:MAG: hypothetical protein ACK5LP_01210 [Campylobacteraceae bacterium]